MPAALTWLRRDLRLADQPALCAALAQGETVVPVFCLDRRLLAGRHRSGARTQFLLECLRELDAALRQRGSGLVVLDGAPERELPALARELGAREVHASADVGPYARRRDERVSRALRAVGVQLRLHPGLFAVDDPAAVTTLAGAPHTVFTPYLRAWLRAPRRPVLPAPSRLPPLPAGVAGDPLPSLEQLGLSQPLSQPAPGGERAARRRLASFLEHELARYERERDTLAAAGTSSLSPYLHFGCISAREIEQRLELRGGAGAQELRRQLCWRDFYAQVLRAFPRNARSEHQRRYRGTLRWSRSRLRFDAWREGRTGYPVVDAAMRQLAREGWMHNRARLIVGCFLTKDLGIDWRWGERWFMRMLLDGDEASNNGNWQWIASVGVDPQPPARRLYNPVLQQRRHDPRGAYVRRHVPELARVPDAYLAEPWTMPPHVQAAARCVIGRDYPAPIVEHAHARREALARYAAAR
ncbi:MAG TPA: deoxyribodipyrimidine photo-lyase [Solirubrobacteraceae bacterium]|nr:deoxyribodipyrimidine photo-lyase [Solirubrobacteraceae bacterium]